MAYNFSRINAALGSEDPNGKQNIFAQPAEMGQPGDGGSQQPKTEARGASAGSSAGGETVSAQPMSQAANSQAAVQAAQSKAGTPKFTQGLDASLKASQHALQSEADAYTKKYQDQAAGYKVGTDVLDKAIVGDKDAQAKYTQLSGRTADATEQFAPETDVVNEDVAALTTQSGLGNLISREAGRGKLRGNEALFDARVLMGAPEFQRIRAALQGQQDQLVKSADDMRTSKTDESQKLLEDSLKAAKDESRGYLETSQTSLMDAQKAEAAAENALREAMRKGTPEVKAKAQKFYDRAVRALASEERKRITTDSLMPYLKKTGIDPMKYLQVGKNVTEKDVIDADEANRFNNIMGLLGTGGDNFSAGGGAAAGRLNRVGDLQADIQNRAGKLNAGANENAAIEKAGLMKMLEGKVANLQAARDQKQLSKGDLAYLRGLETESGMKNNMIDPTKFWNDQAIGLENVIDPRTARLLNKASSELGEQDRYSAGQAGGGFDREAYKQALLAYKGQNKLPAIQAGQIALGQNIPGVTGTTYQSAYKPIDFLGEDIKVRPKVRPGSLAVGS